MAKPLKVGFLAMSPIWEPLGWSVRPRMLIIHLAKLGVEVHLFSPFKPDPTLGNGVQCHQFAMPPLPPAGAEIAYKLTRRAFQSHLALNYFFYTERYLKGVVKKIAAGLRPLLQEHPCDILQGEMDIPSAALLEGRPSARTPVVTDLLDLWAESEAEAGRIKEGGPAYRTLQKITAETIAASDLVLVGNEELSRYLKTTFGVSPAKVTISNNSGESWREQRRKTDNIPRVIYAGNLEAYNQTDLFAYCLPVLKQLVPDAEPLIVGKGPDRRRLKNILTGFGRDFAECLKGPLPREELLKLLTRCDAGVLTNPRPCATPLKLFDYLSVGLPVVALKGFWWSKVIEEHKVGITTEQHPRQLAEGIATLLRAPDLQDYSVRAKRLVDEEWNWTEAAKTLIRAYEKIG